MRELGRGAEDAVLRCPAEVATGRVSLMTAASRRWSEKLVTQTRSWALVRSRTCTSGTIAPGVLMSMLTRTSGNAPRSSSSCGTGSCPAMRARETSRQDSSGMAPRRSVTRSRVSS